MRTVLIVLVFVALCGISALGWPWNLPLVVFTGWFVGKDTARG